MFISSLTVENFRGFKNKTNIAFNEGLNVIIGENISGKKTVLKALQLIFDINNNGRLSINDINKNIDDLKNSPLVTNTATIKSSKTDRYIDKALVAGWLAKFDFQFLGPLRDANQKQGKFLKKALIKYLKDNPEEREQNEQLINNMKLYNITRVE